MISLRAGCKLAVLLLVTLPTLLLAQPGPPSGGALFIQRRMQDCSAIIGEGQLCYDTDDFVLCIGDGNNCAQLVIDVPPGSTPTIQATFAQGNFIASADTTTPLLICNNGGTNCTGVARWELAVDGSGNGILRFRNASGNLVTESKAVYDGSNWITSIGNGAGVQQTCITVSDAGIATFASGTESCGQLASVTRITSSAADPSDSGVVRLGNAEEVCWESSPAGTDNCLTVNSSEQLTFNGSQVGSGSGQSTISTTYTADAIGVDGTQCIRTVETLVSRPETVIINCTDNAAAAMYVDVVLHPDYDAGAITIGVGVEFSSNQNGEIIAFNPLCTCFRDGDVFAAPPATATTYTFSVTDGNQDESFEFNSAAVTPGGTCTNAVVARCVIYINDTTTNLIPMADGEILYVRASYAATP